MVAEGRGSSPNGNITVVNIYRSEESLLNCGVDSIKNEKKYDIPVHLNGVDLVEYLKNQGCVIQQSEKYPTHAILPNEKVSDAKKDAFDKLGGKNASQEIFAGESVCSSYCNNGKRMIMNNISNDHFNLNKRSTGTETSWPDTGNDIVTEQIAKIILQNRESFRCVKNNVTVNKGVIVDQNVGVSGEVLMVSPCTASKTSPVSEKEQSPRHSPTVVYIGTIEEKDVDQLLKSVDVLETVEEIESGLNSLTLSYYEPAASEKFASEFSEGSTRCSDYRHLLQVADKPLASPALLLQWRVRPPDDDLRDEDNSSPITPSSSMFSSAYTVTELGSDNNSDRSPPSEYSHSSRRISETDDVTNREDVQDIRFQEYLQLFRQLTSVNQALLLGDLEDAPKVDSRENSSVINELRRQGSTRSIIFNYISSKDEKEKEEEELWVANEATYCSSEEHRGEVFHHSKISCVPTVNLVINQEVPQVVVQDAGKLSCRTGSSRLSPVSTASASTQTIYSCLLPPLNYYSVPKRSDKSRNSSAGADALPSPVHSHASSSAVSAKDEQMAALICPPASTERRHFSARQRYVENDVKKTECIGKEITLEDVGSRICYESANENLRNSSSPITSSTTQQPTKRFSFLIRSSGMDPQDIVKLNAPISASDKAILAHLEELKVNQVKETPLGKKASSSLHPPCRRCNEPVYPQERLQPSKEMLFHTSCFKCSQCGVRLNLKTFFRNPLTLKDYRIFCKSHVPTLDPGKVAQEKKLNSELCNENAATSCRVSSVAISSQSNASEDRVVVKGDTQGLRYF